MNVAVWRILSVGNWHFVHERYSSHNVPHATAYPCRMGFPLFKAWLSKAWPIVCPRFRAFLMPFSYGSLFTTSSLILTLVRIKFPSAARFGSARLKFISSRQCCVLLMSPCLSISAYPDRMFG